jgi:hypothetical protein
MAKRHQAQLVPKAVGFVLAYAAVLVIALRGSGSYDLVIRNELAVVVWAVLGVGCAVGVFPIGRWTGAARWLLASLFGLATWTALALLWTSSAERTWVELSRVIFFLGVVALVMSAVDRKNRGAVLAGVFAGAATVVGLALLSRMFPATFPGGHVDALPANLRRLSYPFGYWNAVGCLGAMVSVAGLCGSAGARSRAVRAACLAAATLAVPTAYLTYSRGAVIAAAVGLLVALAASKNRWVVSIHAAVVAVTGAASIFVIRSHDAIADGSGTSGRWAVMGVVLTAMAVCAVAAAATLPLDGRLRMSLRQARITLAVSAIGVVIALAIIGPRLADKAWHSFNRTPVAATTADPAARLTNLNGSRKRLWAAALDAFDQQPVHGIGPGTYEFWWGQDPNYNHYARDAHSLYFETLGELGIVGLALLVLAIGSALWAALAASRRRSMSRTESAAATAAAAALAVWVTFAFYDWMWVSTAVTMIALAGASAAAARTRRANQPVALPLRIAVPVIGLLALLVQLPPLASTSQVRGSEQAAARGDLPLALARANDAIGTEPWASTPYLQRGLVEEMGGALAAAAADVRRAAERQPEDYRPWLILSRIEAKAGHAQAALAAYRRAIVAKPSIVKRAR